MIPTSASQVRPAPLPSPERLGWTACFITLITGPARPGYRRAVYGGCKNVHQCAGRRRSLGSGTGRRLGELSTKKNIMPLSFHKQKFEVTHRHDSRPLTHVALYQSFN